MYLLSPEVCILIDELIIYLRVILMDISAALSSRIIDTTL